MSGADFNYISTRSEKARISVWFNKRNIKILSFVAFILLTAGIVAVFYDMIFGWLMIGLSSIAAMCVEWYSGELHHMKPNPNPQTIDDVLSADILGRLPSNPSPRDVAIIISGVTGGQFMEARFGLGMNFLKEISSDNKDDMPKVWREAWSIYKKTNSNNISASVLVVAILSCKSNHQRLLSHLQLTLSDLTDGVNWYNYLRKLVDEERRPRLKGGFARDWAFGWTPMLKRFGYNISEQISAYDASMHRLVAHDKSIDKLIHIFGNGGKQNAILVGPDGVGKNQIINTFASRLMEDTPDVPNNLKFRQIFMLDASALISAASGRGEIENLLPKVMLEAFRAKNIIICLDNAQLFFQDGIGSVDVVNILMPILESGRLRIILLIDEQNYLKLSKRDPKLVSILNKIVVSPATRIETLAVLQDRSILVEFQNNVTFMYQALQEIYRLSERYIYELAMPGKAISLLELSAHYSEDGLVTAKSVQVAIENMLDIKVGTASSEAERKKLLDLENLIHQRMVNQKRAVQVVSDALRRSRAGVHNQERPIGTFLFLGPTGVGKTELAKALAGIYYGGEDSIIRLDMNEYATADDVLRLISDGIGNAHSLTSKIMKKPFSVVLLDEIEKAHSNVLSSLLQMLDEGILRDVNGREVSFRDAIVIATSNACAEKIIEYIDRGYDVSKFEDDIVKDLIRGGQFKPEFINRFDDIVVFRPLSQDELLEVIDLMIENINGTLSLQQIRIDVLDDAKKYLIKVGYDPHMGARPIRRVVQRAVENTVAKQLLSGKVEPGSTITITLQQIKSILDTEQNIKNRNS